jgi:hypothetical protein
MWTHRAECIDRRCRGAEPLTLGELGEQGATTLGVPREQGSLVLGVLGEQGATTLGVPREQGSLVLGLGSKAPERTHCRRQCISATPVLRHGGWLQLYPVPAFCVYHTPGVLPFGKRRT